MRMRVFILLCVCCLLADGHLPPPDPAAARRAAITAIKACRGKDLRKTMKGDAVATFYDQLAVLGLKQRYSGGNPFFGPRTVRDFGKPGGPNYLLFVHGDRFPVHPGTMSLYLTLLDEQGNVISDSAVKTGYRTYVHHIRLMDAPGGGFPLVVFETGHQDPNSGSLGDHYYGWIARAFDIVRVEDERGVAERNHYLHTKHTHGPIEFHRVRTEEECLADLFSGDRLRLLRTLVWLGGTHWDLQEARKWTEINEPDEKVSLVRTLRANDKVIALLKKLSASDDRWLREAAQLAADPKDTH